MHKTLLKNKKNLKTLSLEKFCMVFKTFSKESIDKFDNFIHSACLYNCFFVCFFFNLGSEFWICSSEVELYHTFSLKDLLYKQKGKEKNASEKWMCVWKWEWEEGREGTNNGLGLDWKEEAPKMTKAYFLQRILMRFKPSWR